MSLSDSLSVNVTCINDTRVGCVPSLQGSEGQTDSVDAVIYVVVVLAVYTSAMVILLVKYLKREMRDAYLSHYFVDYNIESEAGSLQLQNKTRLQDTQSLLKRQYGPGWAQCYSVCTSGKGKQGRRDVERGGTSTAPPTTPVKVWPMTQSPISPPTSLTPPTSVMSDMSEIPPSGMSDASGALPTPAASFTSVVSDMLETPPAPVVSDMTVTPSTSEALPTSVVTDLSVILPTSEAPPTSVVNDCKCGQSIEDIVILDDLDKVTLTTITGDREMRRRACCVSESGLNDGPKCCLLQDKVTSTDSLLCQSERVRGGQSCVCSRDSNDRQTGETEGKRDRQRTDSGFYSRSESCYSVCSTGGANTGTLNKQTLFE